MMFTHDSVYIYWLYLSVPCLRYYNYTVYMLYELLDICYPCLQNMYFIITSGNSFFCCKYISAILSGTRGSWCWGGTTVGSSSAIQGTGIVGNMPQVLSNPSAKKTVSFATEGINKSVGRKHPQSCSYKPLNMCKINLGWLGGFKLHLYTKNIFKNCQLVLVDVTFNMWFHSLQQPCYAQCYT